MSGNVSNINAQNIPKVGLASEVKSSLAFSAVLSGGFGAVSNLRRNGKNAIKSTVRTNNVVSGFLKKVSPKTDSFTKSLAAGKNYEIYSAQKKAYDISSKKLEKYLDNKYPKTFIQKIRRLFYSDKHLDKLTKKASEAKKAFDASTSSLKKGVDISNMTKSSLKTNAKTMLKETTLNPINLAFIAMQAITRFKDEALPTFKEEGFMSGIKKTGVVLSKTLVDTVSNAGFSAVLKTLGSRVGFVFGPIGAAIGGTVGDIVGSVISNRLVVKLFGEDKMAQQQIDGQKIADTQMEAPQEVIQEQAPQEVTQEQVPQEVIQEQVVAEAPINKNPISANKTPKSAYIRPINGVYATSWVNQLKNQQGDFQQMA